MPKLHIFFSLLISPLLYSCVFVSEQVNPVASTTSMNPVNETNKTIENVEAGTIKSHSGFLAKFVRLPGEGEGKTVIWKNGRKITEILYTRPISFSPIDDILLLAECSSDDDNRQFLLNIGHEELAKEGSRLNYIFGGRYRTNAIWSLDGKKITLQYYEGLSSKNSETFQVDQLLSQ